MRPAARLILSGYFHFPEAETAGEEQADRAWCSSSRERKGWRRSQGGASGREGGGGAPAVLLVLQQGFPIIPDPQVELLA
jgi:hypothetical protein